MVNLMLLDMTNFDVILGMDWLASCHATLDCHNKSIKFNIYGESTFMFHGDRSEVLCNLISMLSAQQMLRKGCRGILDFVRDIEKEVESLEQVTIVSEFPDVFPEELPSLLPNRAIDFF